MALNARQTRFVAEYLTDFNATRSAIAAGYSPRTARSQGSRLLTHVDIARLVAEAEQSAADQLGLDHLWVLNQLVEMATAGQVEGNRLRAIELVGKHLAAFTERIEHTGIGLTVTVNGVDMDDLR